MSANLYGLGCRPAPPELTPALNRVLRRFNSVRLRNPSGFPACGRSTSFSRRSAATKSGTWSSWSATPIAALGDQYWHPPEYCGIRETPLQCELRLIRPGFVFILAGTNDIDWDSSLGLSPGARAAERLRPVISQARSRGVVPVLSTIPPIHPADPERAGLFEEGVRRTNSRIFRLATERKVPLINLWRGLTGPGMINQGLSADGLHLGVAGAGEIMPSLDPDPSIFTLSTDFSAEALRHGANRRNLIFLKSLAVLDRASR
ncbi:MAG: SGNH/GDSL hydrolase family protein [Solirubrobacterales bacterium]|nr:SGNH/GDSL hydrolase family protein [Solirubrobacterales bacterium]